MQTASMSLAPTTSRQSPWTRPMPNSPATRSPDSLLRLATDTSSTPGWALSFGMWWSLVFLPAPTKPTRIGRSVMMGSSLAVVETRDDELRLEGWPRHEGDEGSRRLRCGRPRGHGGGIGGDLLKLFRKRPHELHALHGQDLADLVHAELGLAFHDRLRRVAARPENGLFLHRVGDAQALEHAREVDPAGGSPGGIRVHDGLRGQDRPLERFRGRDVGQRGALAHGDSDGRPGEVGPGVRYHEPLPRELLEDGVGDDDHIRGLARLHFLPQLPRGRGGDDDGVP